ncbi:hypothetical protein D1631_18580 [Chryseobacterium nematophagum]|uniref:Uncharacterized protein n=1 Tax=Chryseobacterium nematophagum TaxID=2305228 RepID=A0A3M7TCE9_9FLAO|nr:hypothetical protein [Chryseobacterium nematophagum]RNA60497.1 hypothetical protein D1631_18580 [Chryseobacterium nematophagum]
MRNQIILEKLKSYGFIKIINKGNWIKRGSIIYAKEINPNIYLLFVAVKGANSHNKQAFIVEFESVNSIGKYEPLQIMFYMSIKNKNDLLYFRRYLQRNTE